jgi:MFS family permease
LRAELPFLFAYGTLICGTAIATLAATGITTRAGGHGNGAIYTSVFLSTVMLSGALAVPYAPSISARFGLRNTVMFALVGGAALWLVAGLLVLGGVEPVPVLMVCAVGFGSSFGLFNAISPLYSKAYIASQGMAGAYARLSLAGGLAWAVGAAAAPARLPS